MPPLPGSKSTKNYFKGYYRSRDLTPEQHIAAVHVAEEIVQSLLELIPIELSRSEEVRSILLSKDEQLITQVKDLVLAETKKLIEKILIL